MKKILIFGILVGLWIGVTDIWNWVRYSKPEVVTLAEVKPGSVPAYVTLKELTFMVGDSITRKATGNQFLFIPVRAKGADPKSEYLVLVKRKDRALVAAAENQSVVESLKGLAEIAGKTEVTGMREPFGATEREIAAYRKVVPLLSKDVVVVVEGESPSVLRGMLSLATVGVVLLVSARFSGGGTAQELAARC